MLNEVSDIEIQRKYYAATAHQYHDMHNSHESDEHYFALSLLAGVLDYLGIKSILDVGSGVGRALGYLKQKCPHVKVIGIEPVKELRAAGHERGIPKEDLIDGDAIHLQFRDGAFDMVCEFGVLHHIKRPSNAVSEMLRVSKKAIFISDANNFGQGSMASRTVKQLFNSLGLWSVANFVKTRGKGYSISEGDGLFYSYSVFDSYRQVRRQCNRIHVINTVPGGINPYRTAAHAVLLGIKKSDGTRVGGRPSLSE